jgi:hypothetical protein
MSQVSCLRPARWELAALVGIAAFYAAGMTISGASDFANWAGPICLTGTLAAGALRMVRLEGRAIWTALFTFRIATIAYFGVGALVPFLVSDATLIYLQAFFRFNAQNILEFNILVALSAFTVLFVSYIIDVYRPMEPIHIKSGTPLSKAEANARMRWIGNTFLCFGLLIKYGIVVPHTLGWETGQVSGIIFTASSFYLIGIYLITAWSVIGRNRDALVLITSVAVIDSIVNVILLSKTEIMTLFAVYSLGFLSATVSKAKIAATAVVGIAIFAVSQPLVAYGRNQLHIIYGRNPAVGFEERLSIIGSYFEPHASVLDSGGGAGTGALTRISYINQAAFAMDARKRGIHSNSLSNIAVVVIPRFLWPNKPNVTQFGQDFVTMATGQRTGSSASPGLFAEAYWNFGWMGVLYLIAPLGIIYTFLSRFSLRVLRLEDWIFLPVVLMGLRMGSRVDGNYVGDVPGALVITICLYWTLRAFTAQFQNLSARAAAQGSRSVGSSRDLSTRRASGPLS